MTYFPIGQQWPAVQRYRYRNFEFRGLRLGDGALIQWSPLMLDWRAG